MQDNAETVMERGADRELYKSMATPTTLAWQIAALSIMIAAALLRLYKLEIKPLHNDEGVNAFFFVRLFGDNIYAYDPANYHGPTLYYFTLIACSVSTLFFGARGVSTFVIRLVPALFGVATVWLILRLRGHLSATAVLTGSALAAASPGATYFSRDYIHESTFVFFTLALVIAVLHWYRKGTTTSFAVAAAMAALLFATKETAVITVAVLVLAFITTDVFASRERITAGAEGPKSVFRNMLDRFGGPRHTAWLLLGGVGMFLGLVVLFFSSFLGNYPKGLQDAVGALKFWVHVGAKEHRHGPGTYIFWLGREELPLLVLGVAGTTLAAVMRQRFALFAGLWAFFLLAAYSFIPYKTPWLTINFIIPLAIVAGYAVEVIHRMLSTRSTTGGWIWLALFVLAMTSSIYSGIQLNFYHYDDDRNPYVYAQTRREFLSLVETINTIAHRSGSGYQTSIAVMSPIYWPLPWYLRDYRRAGYYGRISDVKTDIVIGSEAQELQLALLLGKDYEWIGSYLLRPGVTLVLFAHRQVFGSLFTSPGIYHANAQPLGMACPQGICPLAQESGIPVQSERFLQFWSMISVDKRQ